MPCVYLRRINTDFARESRHVDFVIVNVYDVTIIYGVSRFTVRASSALLLRILVDGKDFVDDAS